MLFARYTEEVVDNDHTYEQGQRLEASQEWLQMMDRVRQAWTNESDTSQSRCLLKWEYN